MNNLYYWFIWLNREKITLFIGTCILVLEAIFPWYELPPEALKTFDTNLFWENSLRILAAIFVILGFAFTFWLKITHVPRLAFWSGLAVTLLFPYLIVTWSPSVNFLGNAYYDKLIAVGNHVATNFPEVQAQWKQEILLPTPALIKSNANLSIKDSRFFQMSSWDQVLTDGFGYSNSFFSFIGRGWSFTVIGLVVSLFALYLGLADESISLFLKDMAKFIPGVGLVLATIVFSLISINIFNHRLDTMFAKGEYQQVMAISKVLVSCYPSLKGDEAFLQRLAEAEFYSNEPDPALISFAKGLESYRAQDFRKAQDYFQQSLNLQPSGFLVRGYLSSAIINQGVNYLNDHNSHNPGAAADSFEEALRILPGDIEALYDLMLARIVNGDFEGSASAGQDIIESQKYVQQPNIALLGQAYLHLAWANYHNDDMAKTWKGYRQSIDTSTWKQSTEVEK